MRIPVWSDEDGMPAEWTNAHYFFLDELQKIAEEDEEGSNAPADEESAGIGSVSSLDVGAREDQLIRCDKCAAEVKEKGAKYCPRCGTPIKRVPPGKVSAGRPDSDNDRGGSIESGPTGGEAAVNEELSEGSYADTGKYAAITPATWKNLGTMDVHPLIMKLKGAMALGGGGYVGVKGNQVLSRSKAGREGESSNRHYVGAIDQQVQKHAGVKHVKGSRLKAFNFHRRGGNYGSVQQGLDRIAKATAKHSKKVPTVV